MTQLAHIEYGATVSYAGLAAAAGNAAAVRAAASACSHNPLPLVLPCHRVVRSDGRIGELPRRRPGEGGAAELERGSQR